ncbi:MAG: hypothetical protein OXF39_03965 [Nitrospira sp.]|nr:hypothetical protein [Nitrospira sp.]
MRIFEQVGKQVFLVDDGALLISSEKHSPAELIHALDEADALQIICLDKDYKGDDQLKVYAMRKFKARAQAEESEIVFATV